MTVLKIQLWTEPILRTVCEPVTTFDKELKKTVQDMFDTHYSIPHSAGLAAPQVGINKRITVIDFSEKRDTPLCLINPKIIAHSGKRPSKEGCLSIPKIHETIQRFSKITVEAQDVDGKTFKMEADDFMAVCIQHELDHLDGVLFIDHLPKLKQKMVERKLAKVMKELNLG